MNPNKGRWMSFDVNDGQLERLTDRDLFPTCQQVGWLAPAGEGASTQNATAASFRRAILKVIVFLFPS